MKLTNTRCQCTGCGGFFNSVYAFDRHRRWDASRTVRKCLSPGEMLDIGMAKNAAGYWVGAKQVQSTQSQFHRKEPGKPTPDPARTNRAASASEVIPSDQQYVAPRTHGKISPAPPPVSSAASNVRKRPKSRRVHGESRHLTEPVDAQAVAARDSEKRQYRASSTPISEAQ